MHFRPEFLNRIDETIIFHSLNKKELHQIVKLMAGDLSARIAEQGINLKITPAAIDEIAKIGYNPAYGARPLRRALQDHVEDSLSTALLDGQIKVGDDVTIGAHRGQLTMKIRNANTTKPVLVKMNK